MMAVDVLLLLWRIWAPTVLYWPLKLTPVVRWTVIVMVSAVSGAVLVSFRSSSLNHGPLCATTAVRHDFYFLNELEYVDIGIAEAQRLIRAGVGTVDEQEFPDSARRWREDEHAMDSEVVFASMAADLG